MAQKNSDYRLLRSRRNEYGVSQNRLATTCGLSRLYLNQIEDGGVTASMKTTRRIFNQLESLDPGLSLTLLSDYVRIRFPTVDVRKIIQEILHLKFDCILHEDYAFYSCQEQYVMGDTMVMLSHKEDKGVLLELKGRGCR